MNCQRYLNLSPLEKKEFIAKLLHAIQSDDDLLREAERIVSRAKMRGHFHGVRINPPLKELNGEQLRHITQAGN